MLAGNNYAWGLINLLGAQLSVLAVDPRFFKRSVVWNIVKDGIAPLLEFLVRDGKVRSMKSGLPALPLP